MEVSMDDYRKPKTIKHETKKALKNDNLDYLGLSSKLDYKPVQKNNNVILGWILSFCILSSVLMIIVLVKLSAVESKLASLSQGTSQSSSTTSSSSPTDYTSTLNSIQTTVNAIQTKVNTPAISSSSHTCNGTFSQDLSGTALQSGSDTFYNLSGSSPLNLTCY
jgi:cytoskeletal protein RodZ